MKRFLAVGLLVAILFQFVAALSIMVRFELDRERITALFCVNKDKPELNCHGTCHLNKQLQEQKATPTEDPAVLAEWDFIVFGLVENFGKSFPAPHFTMDKWNDAFRSVLRSASPCDIFHPPRVEYT